MQVIFNIRKTVAVCLMLIVSMTVTAQEYTREVKKEFPVTADTRLEIYNKYGNVDVVNHDLASLIINVVVKVNTKNKDKAEDLLNMITVNISQNGNTVKAVTEISENFGRYFRSYKSDKEGFQINYTITMPKTLPVYLSNKYGNVFIDELVSSSTIDVKYGKLTANKILHDSKEPLTKIYLSYSTGSIQESRWLEADLKYSKLNLTQSKALAILSKYSKVYITDGSSVVSESKYDTYEIDKLSNLVTNAGYSHFKIGSLSGKLQVESKYSDVIIDRIPSTFEGIKVNNSYGSFKLGIDPSASYKINSYSKYCNVIYPESKSKVNRISENNELKINGVVGSAGEAKAEVSVNSRYGNVRLVE